MPQLMVPQPPPTGTGTGTSLSSYTRRPLPSFPMSRSDGSESGSAEPTVHEGLHVYTVGHLVHGIWAFEAGLGTGAGGILEFGAQRQREGEYGRRLQQLVKKMSSVPRLKTLHRARYLLNHSCSPFRNAFSLPAHQPSSRGGQYPRAFCWSTAMMRSLSKFFWMLGCTTHIDIDGVGVVTRVNLEKCDFAFMDIVAPELDALAATSLICKFDQGNPIIS